MRTATAAMEKGTFMTKKEQIPSKNAKTSQVKAAKASSRDKLAKTSKKGDIDAQLSEADLDAVAGGHGSGGGAGKV